MTDVESRASWVKRAMLERAESAAMMLDHGKFEVRLLEVVAPLSRYQDLYQISMIMTYFTVQSRSLTRAR